MNKFKLLTITALGISLTLNPTITDANDDFHDSVQDVNSIQNLEIVPLSLANARASLSKNGTSLIASASIATSSSVRAIFVLQKKVGASWSNISYSTSLYNNRPRYSFEPSSKGTYRIRLQYSIGSKSDNVISNYVIY